MFCLYGSMRTLYYVSYRSQPYKYRRFRLSPCVAPFYFWRAALYSLSTTWPRTAGADERRLAYHRLRYLSSCVECIETRATRKKEVVIVGIHHTSSSVTLTNHGDCESLRQEESNRNNGTRSVVTGQQQEATRRSCREDDASRRWNHGSETAASRHSRECCSAADGLKIIIITANCSTIKACVTQITIEETNSRSQTSETDSETRLGGEAAATRETCEAARRETAPTSTTTRETTPATRARTTTTAAATRKATRK